MPEVKADALKKLGEAQKGDFLGMFKAMEGLPVIVRLLDPPLHEFLDDPRELEVEIAKLDAASKALGAAAAYDDALAKMNVDLQRSLESNQALLKQLDSFQEANPMPVRKQASVRLGRIISAFKQSDFIASTIFISNPV